MNSHHYPFWNKISTSSKCWVSSHLPRGEGCRGTMTILLTVSCWKCVLFSLVSLTCGRIRSDPGILQPGGQAHRAALPHCGLEFQGAPWTWNVLGGHANPKWASSVLSCPRSRCFYLGRSLVPTENKVIPRASLKSFIPIASMWQNTFLSQDCQVTYKVSTVNIFS